MASLVPAPAPRLNLFGKFQFACLLAWTAFSISMAMLVRWVSGSPRRPLRMASTLWSRGILPTLGIQPAATVTDAQWSWFANWINYGLVGLIFIAEFLYRKRRFPGRYKSLLDFGRKVAGLGPAFWRDLLK